MATMTAWQTLSYGFSPVYFVTVSGIPGVFVERPLGKTLPAGFTSFEDGSLSIDQSAAVGVDQVDRERGIAVGLSFSFKLLDRARTTGGGTGASQAIQWMRRWDYSANLTADLLHGDTTATVDSTTGWPSSGAFYVGQERISYSGTTATTFTGLTRAESGTLACTHRTGTAGQIVTNLPRYWRGRDVCLYAAFADPSGHVCGTALADQAVMVWRGRIEQGPDREPDGFTFSCLSLDRLLDANQLAGQVTGNVQHTAEVYEVAPTWTLTVWLRARDGADATLWSYLVECTPFTAYSSGTLVSGETLRLAISTAWTAAVAQITGASADLGDLVFLPQQDGSKLAHVQVVNDVAIYALDHHVLLDGVENSDGPQVGKFWFAGMPGGADYYLPIGWKHYGNPAAPNDKATKVTTPTGMTVRLTEGLPSDVPSTGQVRVKAGDKGCTYSYASKGDSQGDLYLGGLVPAQGQKALTAPEFQGATAEILSTDEGSWSVLALRCLHSSGTGLRDGTHDTLPEGQGYGLPTALVQQSTFESLLGQAPIGSLDGLISSAGASFADLFGGLLGLFRCAVVAKPRAYESGTPVRLHVVPTGAGSDYVTTITDDDLLAHDSDPVVSVRRADSPNVVVIERQPAGQDEPDAPILFQYHPSVVAQGRREATYRVDGTERDALQNAALAAVAGHFAYDETVQALELRVRPGVLADVGDAVWLTLTHPSLWTWSTSPGQPGYDGPGRVVGREMEPTTCVVHLKVLIDGALRIHALSPAAQVRDFDNAAAPTWVDVDLQYLMHFQTALTEAGADIRVQHYRPGQAEGSTQYHMVSAVAVAGLYCRLTIASTTGGHSLTKLATDYSVLTLPPTANSTDYQQQFAHTGDASQWG